MFNLVMFWTVRLVGEASNQIPSFANTVRSLKKVGQGRAVMASKQTREADATVILRGVAFIYLLAHL
jgi:hypothetical protein